jgi:dTMP kinase
MFIILEGIDGSGKTTQSKKLADYLASRFGQSSVVSTFEPGGWDGGGPLRDIAIRGEFEGRWSRFFLFAADRCEHVARVVGPALDEGLFVVCDRYAASTAAYQIFAGQPAPAEVAEYMARMPRLLGMPEPDVVLFLDIDVDAALARMTARGRGDAFESMGRDYYERVRSGYYGQMESAPSGLWTLIDASRTPEEVFGDIKARIDELLERGR